MKRKNTQAKEATIDTWNKTVKTDQKTVSVALSKYTKHYHAQPLTGIKNAALLRHAPSQSRMTEMYSESLSTTQFNIRTL